MPPGVLRASLSRHERVRRRPEFQRVHERGARTAGKFMTALFLANNLPHGRLGIIASRRLGGSVQRNRAKRLIREFFRMNKRLTSGWDVVVIPKTELLTVRFPDLEADFRSVCQRHAGRTRA